MFANWFFVHNCGKAEIKRTLNKNMQYLTQHFGVTEDVIKRTFNREFKQYSLPDKANKEIVLFCKKVLITNGKQNSKKHGNQEQVR